MGATEEHITPPELPGASSAACYKHFAALRLSNETLVSQFRQQSQKV
jgi:hypothetical protein